MSSSPTPTALLYAYTDTGPLVSDAEYHEWYNEEHVALRMAIPDFLCATRWAATDGKNPAFLAMYDLTSPSALASPSYLALRENQSPREIDVMARLQRADRRVYDAVLDDGQALAAPDYDPRAPGACLVAVEIAVPDARANELARWYRDEHLPLLVAVPGWRRSRRFTLREHGPAQGTEAAEIEARGAPPRLLALHEWTSEASFDTEEFARATGTEWRTRMFQCAEVWERRIFKEIRTWVKE